MSIQMSVEDAKIFIESVVGDKALSIDDVCVIVDYRENRDSSISVYNDGKIKKSKQKSLLYTMEYNPVSRQEHTFMRGVLLTGDAIVLRVVSKTDVLNESDQKIIDTINVDGVSIDEFLSDSINTRFVALSIYERKTATDLVSSLRGKSAVVSEQHMSKQLADINTFCTVTGARPFLLVEGYIPHALTGEPVSAMNEDGVHSFQCGVLYKKGITVIQSSSTSDTARFLHKEARYVRENHVHPSGWTRLGTGEDYIPRLHAKKQDNYDVKTWYRGVLQAIPSVSQDRAFAIMAVYPTLRKLIRAYDNCETIAEREKLLEDFRPTTGTKRRFAEKLSKKIYERIFVEEEEDEEEEDEESSLDLEDLLDDDEEEEVIVTKKKKKIK